MHGAPVKLPLLLQRVIEILREQGSIALVRRGAARALEPLLFRLAPERYEAQSNFRLSVREMRAHARLMRATPRELTLETTTACNLRCVMCPHAFDTAHAKGGEFPESAAEKLRSYIRRASRFQLHGTGEPMLSRTFWRLLEIIKRDNRGKPEITFNSNGTALNDTNIGRLIDAGVSHISVSLDAARSTTFRKIRGASFDVVLANVRRLIKARDAAGSELRVALNATLMRVNIEELPELVDVAKDAGADEIAFWPLNAGDNNLGSSWVVDRPGWTFRYAEEALERYPRLANEKIRETMERAEQLGIPIMSEMNKQRFYDETAPDREYDPQPRADALDDAPAPNLVAYVSDKLESWPRSSTVGQCQAPWRWLMVASDGSARPCCFAQKSIGNVVAQEVEDVWNGAIMQEVRSAIGQDRIHPVCEGAACKFVMGK